MDKIWDGNPSKSEVSGRCGGNEKKNEGLRRTDKSRTLKKYIYRCIYYDQVQFTILLSPMTRS